MIELTGAKLATTLFALRFLQSNIDEEEIAESEHFRGEDFDPLTEEQIDNLCEELVCSKSAYDGSKCPNCKSKDIIGEDFDPSGPDTAYRNCNCEACGAVWTEAYKVTGYDNLEVPSAKNQD